VVEMLVVIQILVMNQLRVKSLLMNQLLLSQTVAEIIKRKEKLLIENKSVFT
jgi:hypothetical protein